MCPVIPMPLFHFRGSRLSYRSPGTAFPIQEQKPANLIVSVREKERTRNTDKENATGLLRDSSSYLRNWELSQSRYHGIEMEAGYQDCNLDPGSEQSKMAATVRKLIWKCVGLILLVRQKLHSKGTLICWGSATQWTNADIMNDVHCHYQALHPVTSDVIEGNAIEFGYLENV